MELSKRDKLYNAILETVKKHGAGMEIGLVRAVLTEVDGEIAMRVGHQSLDIVSDKLKENPRNASGIHGVRTGNQCAFSHGHRLYVVHR